MLRGQEKITSAFYLACLAAGFRSPTACVCRAFLEYDLRYACERPSRQRPSIRRHNADVIFSCPLKRYLTGVYV
jgi:hypothetical protein